MRWLAAIPDLIRIGRKAHKAATEPDEEKVHPNAWSHKTVEHVRGQINSATSHKVPNTKSIPHEKEAPIEKKTLDQNPYSSEPTIIQPLGYGSKKTRTEDDSSG